MSSGSGVFVMLRGRFQSLCQADEANNRRVNKLKTHAVTIGTCIEEQHVHSKQNQRGAYAIISENNIKSKQILNENHIDYSSSSSSSLSSASSSHFKNGSLAFLTRFEVSLSTYFLLTCVPHWVTTSSSMTSAWYNAMRTFGTRAMRSGWA